MFKLFKKLELQTAADNGELTCTCKKKSCPRYKKCDECRSFHYGKGSRPYCERG